MSAPHVSIIIPVYNSEKYALECYESIRSQIYTDFEVLLVNDGSTDGSAQLAADYIAEHNLQNWRLFNKENGGPSSARNVGLDNANGDWIAFIDSDDWVTPDYLQAMVHAADSKNADLCMTGIRAYRMDTMEYESWCTFRTEYGKIPEDLKDLESFGYVHSHIYRRSVLEKHHIRFDERIRYYEDSAFNYDFIAHIHSFACVQECKYNYRRIYDGNLTSKAVHPVVKKHVYEHIQDFYSFFSEDALLEAAKTNADLRCSLWDNTYTAVFNDILEGKYKSARTKVNGSLIRRLLTFYQPRTKKDKLVVFLWKHSFLLLILLVNLYYRNFTRLRKSRLLKAMSR